jgi:excisionase family DNA binding protein
MTTNDATNTDAPKHAYSVAEALTMVPLSRNAFYAAVKKGDIPSVRVGGRVLIPRAPFDRMFA